MSAPAPKLLLQGVAKSFRTAGDELAVLRDINLSVPTGRFVSIIGPSGCGKTTVFNIIAGLLAPDSGTILVDGQPVPNLRGRVGYMMQKDLLFPWRTVLDNVILGLELKRVPKPEAYARARDQLHSFGLGGFEHAYPKALSGGMRQRVALARTLICDPDILLLDEPFSALDYQTRLYLESVLADAVQTLHTTVILVTHDIDEAVALSDEVVVLSGRPAHVKARHPIHLASHSPIDARSDPDFAGHFHQLCAELDIQTRRNVA